MGEGGGEYRLDRPACWLLLVLLGALLVNFYVMRRRWPRTPRRVRPLHGWRLRGRRRWSELVGQAYKLAQSAPGGVSSASARVSLHRSDAFRKTCEVGFG
ncbi:hypothetical protein [Hyalangium versicolor]|uniref:hypothetical protein n=1 Tax=Hyalangium versicolor TaxID=2861190 RepID=UPI00359F5B6F